MKLLDAKVRWYEEFSNHPKFELLVDKMPRHGKDGDLRYRTKKISGGTLYYAELDGYVNFMFHDPRDQSGFGGRQFELPLEDGTIEIVTGPWSSNSMFINKEFNVTCCECAIIDERKDFDRGYTFYASAVDIRILKEAAKLAKCHLFKVTTGSENEGYQESHASDEQIGVISSRNRSIYYVPSLSNGKPTKWTHPYGKKTPRLERAIFDDSEKIITELLV